MPRERGMRRQRMAGERLLEPQRARRLERRQAAGGLSHVLPEDLSGVDQQRRIRPDPLTCRHELVDIGGKIPLPNGPQPNFMAR